MDSNVTMVKIKRGVRKKERQRQKKQFLKLRHEESSNRVDSTVFQRNSRR